MSKNYPTRGIIDKPDVQFFDPEKHPFRIHGVWKEDGLFCRMPGDIAQKVSPNVYGFSRCSAGGRVRFVTDSAYVIIRTKLRIPRDCHQALTGGCGYDLYTTYDGQTCYGGTFMFPADFQDTYEALVDLPVKRKQLITINMPLFAEVSELSIGLQENCLLEEAPDYSHKTPVVYYGSSITHGGCASRAGTCYTSMVSRRFDTDYISLGFNGSARGETELAKYIAGLKMSIFVLDYDHNSPLEELRENHARFFRIIRDAQPELPILMMSRPKFYLNDEEIERYNVVRGTYERAKAAGDENVWFLSGPELMQIAGDEGTVDNCHPTDLGFFSMAAAVSGVFEEIYRKQQK